MKSRLLGATGLRVSEIGLGAWQLGNALWGGTDGEQALRIVDSALDAGCNFFDTAPGHGAKKGDVLLVNVTANFPRIAGIEAGSVGFLEFI